MWPSLLTIFTWRFTLHWTWEQPGVSAFSKWQTIKPLFLPVQTAPVRLNTLSAERRCHIISKTAHFRCCSVLDETCGMEWGHPSRFDMNRYIFHEDNVPTRFSNFLPSECDVELLTTKLSIQLLLTWVTSRLSSNDISFSIFDQRVSKLLKPALTCCYIWFSEEGNGRGRMPTQALPRCTKCNSPPINGQCTNHRIAV